MRRVLFLLVLLSAFTIPQVSAQESIAFGDLKSGEITADQPVVQYTFDGVEGDTLYIFMYTPNDDLIPAIRLTALGGVVVAEADDNMSLGAMLGPITLAGAATYTVEATRPEWDTESSGEFELVMDRYEPTAIEAGETVTGTFARGGALNFYTLTGTANEVVRYSTTGTDLELTISGPDGEYFVRDGIYDNIGNLFGVVPQDGEYTVLLQTASRGGTDYSLTIRELEVAALTEEAPVTGSISEGDPLVFSFEGEEAKLIALNAAVNGADDQRLSIYGGGENGCCEILTDYGSGPNGNPRIDPFIVPTSGTYYAVLSFDNYSGDNASADYEITLGASTLISLSKGVELSDSVTEESGIKSYSYNAQAGETLRITLTQTGGEGWPAIQVFSPETQILSFNSSSIRSLSFEIVFQLEGMYRFEISNANYDPSALEFSLRVE